MTPEQQTRSRMWPIEWACLYAAEVQSSPVSGEGVVGIVYVDVVPQQNNVRSCEVGEEISKLTQKGTIWQTVGRQSTQRS